MRKADLKRQVAAAVAACESKKASGLTILQVGKDGGSFTDYFVICSGSNPRQIQAISDEVAEKLSAAGLRPTHVEGYRQAEWILLDYVDFVIHIFQEHARKFYDLERLWKSAKRLSLSDLAAKKAKKKKKKTARKAAAPAGRARKKASSPARRTGRPTARRKRKG